MRKIVCYLSFTFMLIPFFMGCNQKPVTPVSDGKDSFIEKVYVVNIINNGQKLKEYLDYHKKIWPEVEAGFRKAGYKKITLYHHSYLLVMTVVVPANADLGAMGRIAESYSPHCAEWNQLISQYQTGVPGTAAGQTWVEAESFYTFNN